MFALLKRDGDADRFFTTDSISRNESGITLLKFLNTFIWYKHGLYYGNELITKIKVMEQDYYVKVSLNEFNLLISVAEYKKLRKEVNMLKGYKKELNKFLYDDIMLDEIGICSIISDYSCP
jgi:hypothetical protein